MSVEIAIKRIEDCIKINKLEDPRGIILVGKKPSKNKIVSRTLFNVLDDLRR